MDDNDLYDEELVNSIAPNVLTILRREKFFERLDDRFCPVDTSREPERCQHSFEISKSVLCDLGFDSDEIRDVVAVLHANGACCDCEVLYNVAEENRLKTEYWKARALNIEPYNAHSEGQEI
jgi:hypothetical protein